jgi:tetratricopeptide (TPR) repeat protein
MAKHSTEPAARIWIGPVANNLGWSYADMGRYDEALKLFKLGVEVRHDGPERPYLIARYAVAHAMRKLGRYREALDILFDLERKHQEIGTKDPYVEEELGECLIAVGLQDEAEGHFAQAHQLLKDDEYLQKNEPARLARIKTLAQLPD